MKKINFYFLILSFLLSSCSTLQIEQELSFQSDAIIILHTNDVHAGIDDHIGYAGLSAYKKDLEALYGDEKVILVDAGDAIQGASVAMLTQGASIITLMNAVDYDYMTLGNHEFDYQIPRLFELTEDLNTSIVSANFIRLEDNLPVYSDYEMYSVDGIDIAFVGVTTPESLTKASSQYFQDEKGNFIYTLGEDASGETLYTIVQESVDKARAEGAEYVVAIVHLGIEEASAPWRSTDLIAHVSGIDIVLDGHSHSVIEGEVYKDKDGQDVILSQAGTKLEYIGQVVITPSKGDDEDISARLIHKKDLERAKTPLKKDPEVQALVDEIKEEFESLLSQKVAYSEFDLLAQEEGRSLVREEETNLANLVADAYRALLDTDIALVNAGGIRTDLLKGDITYQEIIDLHPFSNYIISMEVKGKTIKEALEMGAKSSPTSDAGLLHVSGMSYEIDTAIPSSVKIDLLGNFIGVEGAYRVKNIQINGTPLDENKVYSVASMDYLLKRGGDGMTMFKDCKILKDMFMLDNEVLITYIKENLKGSIGKQYENPRGEKRLKISAR